ncbi:MAG: hypothetical protein QM719_08545 [Thermomonas sp.]
MKMRNAIWLAIAACGAVTGAVGSRVFVSAPDIQKISEFPFFEFMAAIPCFLVIAWICVATIGKYSIPFLYLYAALGVYGASYGFFELVFHALNGRPILSSLALMTFGLTILVSCHLAAKIFGNRFRSTAASASASTTNPN